MHTLIVGGTGMLADATRELATRSTALTLVARRPERLSPLRSEHVDRIAIDYHQTHQLIQRLQDARLHHGDVDLAVTWIHSSAETSLLRVADFLDTQPKRARLIDVQSSVVAHPYPANSVDPPPRHAYLQNLHQIMYQRVVLGFVLEDQGSRWLTDREICQGVLQAIETGCSTHIVGTVDPWEQRPR